METSEHIFLVLFAPPPHTHKQNKKKTVFYRRKNPFQVDIDNEK